MKVFKIVGGIIGVIVCGFIAYSIYIFSQFEREKNKSRTANATKARWPKDTAPDPEDFTEETEILNNGN